MQFDAAMASFASMSKEFMPYMDSALLLFVRTLAFIVTAPIFSRKNLPIMLKVSAAIFLTGTLFWMVLPTHGAAMRNQDAFLIFPLIMNITIGTIIGFTANMLIEAISAAGGMMNNQIGLSAAALMDPSTGRQTQVMETLLTYMGTTLFIQIGGMHWMIVALKRSIDVLPLFTVTADISKVISMPYLVEVSGNVMVIGVQLIAPAMIITIAMDVMLGIVNRTAQQIPVFQLSAAIKPAVGLGITLMTLSAFLEAVSQFLRDYSRIF